MLENCVDDPNLNIDNIGEKIDEQYAPIVDKIFPE
jgi:hypothetical protein